MRDARATLMIILQRTLLFGAVFSSIGWVIWASFWGKPTATQVIRVTRNIGGRAGFRTHFQLWQSTFARENPGWTMELIDLGNIDGAEFYKKCIATGDLPEVIMTFMLTKDLSDGGHLQPLPDNFYDKFGVTPPQRINGQYYTAQGGMQLLGIAVNKRMWQSIGVTEPPATWEAFVADLRKLKAKGYMPLALGGKEWSAGMPLWYLMAMNLYAPSTSPDGASWTALRNQGKVHFATDPTMRKVVQNTIALFDEFAPPGTASVSYDEEQRLFYTGKAATWLMGCWIAGGIEAAKVDADIEYWPIPSMTGRPLTFMDTNTMPAGWAITSSAKGEKYAKSLAVLRAFYEKKVYQAFLNGEGQLSSARKIGVTGPQSSWLASQHLYDNMAVNYQKYGATPGYHTLTDLPSPSWHMDAMMRMSQEILSGRRDVDYLLNMLDDAWDATLSAKKPSK